MTQKQLFGVVGNPVTHSLSPRIHQFWYEELELPASYQALDLVSDTVCEDIRALARAGYSGLNVTLPHKIPAFEAASSLSDAAERIGAVNTLSRPDPDHRVWSGDNTDWTGFLWSLDRFTKHRPEKTVLIGAGGAARAVAYALASRSFTAVLVNRTVEKSIQMAEQIALDISGVHALEDLNAACTNADLIINTISLGHSGGSLSLPPTDHGMFLDISYGQAADLTLQSARSNGWQTEDGLPMLIGQAADAFEIWFGIEPDREAALRAAREWLNP